VLQGVGPGREIFAFLSIHALLFCCAGRPRLYGHGEDEGDHEAPPIVPFTASITSNMGGYVDCIHMSKNRGMIFTPVRRRP
jgi:hypothetical protein